MTIPFIFKVVEAEEAREIAAWVAAARENKALIPNKAGPKRFWAAISSLASPPPKALEAVRERVESRLELKGNPVCPVFGHYVSFVEPGGFIHTHTDPFPQGARHVRVNVLVQHAVAGGKPVLECREITIPPGHAWAFRPDACAHGTFPVLGHLPRINISFGYAVAEAYRLPNEETIAVPDAPIFDPVEP